MKRGTTRCGTSIEVNGATVGTLQLLGSELESGALCFLLSSTGAIPALTYICEGVFDEVTHLVDESGDAGNIFIGKRFVEKTPALEPFVQKLNFMEQLARHIAHKVEAQQPKASQ